MTKNNSTLRLFPVLLLSFLFITLVFSPLPEAASLSGELENDLYLSPGNNNGDFLDEFISTLEVEYTMGGITFSSESIFTKDEFNSQTFGADYRVGILDASSTASFDPANTRLDYWLNEGSLTLAGASFDTTFLLEYSSDTSNYGAGLELGLSGNLGEGVSANFVSRFGMKVNAAEAFGLVSGSGYTIVTDHGDESDVYGSSQLQYVNSELQVTGMVLDCCEYDVKTTFSEANGFEETEFEFLIGGEEDLVSFDVDLTFSAQTKSVELNPGINTQWGCFDVYTDLSTPNADNVLGNNSTKESTINGLEVKGFGIFDVSLGHVTFSSLTSLKGNLWRPDGTYDMDLHAGDYLIDPQPVYQGLYDETDYDQLFSLYKSGADFNLTYGADVYFDMSGDATGTDSLFDTALFTSNGTYVLSDQFSLGAGLAIKPDSLETIRLSFDYSF
ncbi:hypothetical protein KGY72_07020 [Candidatus Bipolaricaulota bacterium]|nr:hypothetical protein [Candidatus Bipolaricaulota bacterium]